MTLSVTKAKSSRAKWTRTATIVDGGVDVQMSPATSQIKVEVDPEVYIDTSDRGSMVALLLENSVKAASFSKLLRKAFFRARRAIWTRLGTFPCAVFRAEPAAPLWGRFLCLLN